jgi:hypothetical protein
MEQQNKYMSPKQLRINEYAYELSSFSYCSVRVKDPKSMVGGYATQAVDGYAPYSPAKSSRTSAATTTTTNKSNLPPLASNGYTHASNAPRYGGLVGDHRVPQPQQQQNNKDEGISAFLSVGGLAAKIASGFGLAPRTRSDR